MKKFCTFNIIAYILLLSCKDVTIHQENLHLFTNSQNPKFAAHRVNDTTLLQNLYNKGINAIELDIHLDTINGLPELMLGHEKETSTKIPLSKYIQYIYNNKITLKYIWFDCKDLRDANTGALHFKIINDLNNKYNFKSISLIESRFPNGLTQFTNNNWYTSYYVKWHQLKLDQSLDSNRNIIQDWISEVKSLQINSISYDSKAHKIISEYLDNYPENIELNTWDLSIKSHQNINSQILSLYSNTNTIIINFEDYNYFKIKIKNLKAKLGIK